MPVLATGLVLQSALIAWVCLRGAEASIKTTIRLMLIETGVVLALSATILWVKAGQAGALNLGPFNPADAQTHGLSGFWAAIILGMLAFSGFDVIATAAEEAQAPRQHVPRVLIIAVVGVALFWAVNAWVLTLLTPLTQVLEYNAEGLTAITPVARVYWGWGNVLVVATAFTGRTGNLHRERTGRVAPHLRPGSPRPATAILRETERRKARPAKRGTDRSVDLRCHGSVKPRDPTQRPGQLHLVVECVGLLCRAHLHRS